MATVRVCTCPGSTRRLHRQVGGVPAAQDAVVILDLPEASTASARKLNPSRLLERLDKFRQIARIVRPRSKQMHMIRHHAIRVDEKSTARGVLAQQDDEPSRKPRLRAVSDAWLEDNDPGLKAVFTLPTADSRALPSTRNAA